MNTEPTKTLPYTPRCKKVLALAQKEAHQMGHEYIGVESLLFAILKEGESPAYKLLLECGITPDKIRDVYTKEAQRLNLHVEKEEALAKLSTREKEILGLI
jgi:ATP-dependent Clp protease ATP-binding subunit ClpA